MTAEPFPHDSRRPPQYLTAPEIAAYLRVSKMTVYRLVSEGILPAIRVGRSLRVRSDDFRTYLAGATESGGER